MLAPQSHAIHTIGPSTPASQVAVAAVLPEERVDVAREADHARLLTTTAISADT
jgi:hypothetical protein